eukprot:Nk52_evm85s2192 gene=Nk52_evmTU85s2192
MFSLPISDICNSATEDSKVVLKNYVVLLKNLSKISPEQQQQMINILGKLDNIGGMKGRLSQHKELFKVVSNIVDKMKARGDDLPEMGQLVAEIQEDIKDEMSKNGIDENQLEEQAKDFLQELGQ